MTRVLVKGSSSPLADTNVGWDEEGNLKNHHIAFIDLFNLQTHAHEFSHPAFDRDDAVVFPERDDIWEFLNAGHDLIVRLPNKQESTLRGEDHDGNEARYECDLLKWLPFYVGLIDDEQGDLVDWQERFYSWQWYFNEDFEWETVIETINRVNNFRGQYRDPRPPKSGPVRKTRIEPNPAHLGPIPKSSTMAVDNVNRRLAVEVSLEEPTEGDEFPLSTDGYVYLIPTHPQITMEELIECVLRYEFHFSVDSTPGWVYDYPIPGESELRRRVDELQSEIDSLEATIESSEEYRRLLYEDDDALEESVRDAFRSVGLDVAGEVSGHRDGAILLDDSTIILEITGVSGGVPLGKIDRLHRHVEHARDEGYGDNLIGILVINVYKNDDPSTRSLQPNNFKDDLDEYGYKLMTTEQVYRMISGHRRGDIDTDQIINKFIGDETIIGYDVDIEDSSGSLLSRITAFRETLGGLL